MALMNQTEYAAHRGVSKVAVHKAVKAGRINVVDGKIDPNEADRLWAERSIVRPRTGANGGPPRRAAKASGEPPAPPPPTPPAEIGGSIDYFAERTRREKAQADIAELEAAKMRGDLVPIEDVKRQWEIEASRQREAWLQLADRLAPLLEMRPFGFIRQALDAEVRQILNGLAA